MMFGDGAYATYLSVCNGIEATGNWPNVHGVPKDAIERMRARWEHIEGEQQ